MKANTSVLPRPALAILGGRGGELSTRVDTLSFKLVNRLTSLPGGRGGEMIKECSDLERLPKMNKLSAPGGQGGERSKLCQISEALPFPDKLLRKLETLPKFGKLLNNLETFPKSLKLSAPCGERIKKVVQNAQPFLDTLPTEERKTTPQNSAKSDFITLDKPRISEFVNALTNLPRRPLGKICPNGQAMSHHLLNSVGDTPGSNQ